MRRELRLLARPRRCLQYVANGWFATSKAEAALTCLFRAEGFAGANKVFLFRFNMPHDKAEGFNGDMPALWLLNARIPRTGQYHSCSCWGTKCGEADIFEVLAPGDTKCKSTFHVANGAGSSDWFERPVTAFVTVAVVFHGESASVSIKVLPSDTDFSQGLDDETVESWVRDTHDTEKSSLFQVAG